MRKKDIEKMLQKYLALRPVKRILVGEEIRVEYEEDPPWVKEAIITLNAIEANQRAVALGKSFTYVSFQEGEIKSIEIPHEDVYKIPE